MPEIFKCEINEQVCTTKQQLKRNQMKKTTILTCLLLASCIISLNAQLTYTPAKPVPGGTITFTYTPPENLFGPGDTITCEAQKWGLYEDDLAYESAIQNKWLNIKLKKTGTRYQGTLVTDALTRAVTLNFTSGQVKWEMADRKLVLASGKVDTNDSLGYVIPLYTIAGTEYNYANFFIGKYLKSYTFNQLGFSNAQKSADFFLRELEIYPDALGRIINDLAPVMKATNPAGFNTFITNELNKQFERGLDSASDYMMVATLAYYLNMAAVSGYFMEQGQAKFGESTWEATMSALYDEFHNEKDIHRKEVLMNNYIDKFINSSYEDKLSLAATGRSPRPVRFSFLHTLLENDMLDEHEKYRQQFNFSCKTTPLEVYQFRSELETLFALGKYQELTEQKARQYISFYKERLRLLSEGSFLPATADDSYLSADQLKRSTMNALIVLSDFCAAMYDQSGDYQKAFSYAGDAMNYQVMLWGNQRQNPDLNTRYSLLAEKVLPPAETRKAIGGLVAGGTWKPEMKEVLKRVYIQDTGSENGFEEYFFSLREPVLTDLSNELLKTMINEPSPAFELTDLEGKRVRLEDFKGKVVILDFWATWCGPCKASFPAMQKAVTAYANDPGVKFLFVNTFETRSKTRTDDVIKNEVATFLKDNSYSFHVLFDLDRKVAGTFKVTGVPTKLIIDGNGNIRYRIVGGGIDVTKVMDEMRIMIKSVQ
jgi:thiol-disulfide isomerase/thioredoxin